MLEGLFNAKNAEALQMGAPIRICTVSHEATYVVRNRVYRRKAIACFADGEPSTVVRYLVEEKHDKPAKGQQNP